MAFMLALSHSKHFYQHFCILLIRDTMLYYTPLATFLFSIFFFGHQIKFSVCDALIDWANKVASESLDSILDEFKQLKDYPDGYTAKAFDKNPALNRYPNIVCLDQTRVSLRPIPFSDFYIHANFVAVPKGKKLIATQCPMHESKSTQAAKQSKKQKQPQGHDDDVPKKNTVYDFWSMVIQEDVDTIVMLCELKVGDCIKYWPNSTATPMHFASRHLNRIDVRFEQQEKLNEGEHLFKTRLYVWKKRIGRFTGSKKEGKKEDKNEIQLGQSHKEMAVDHIQWSGWSDNGVLGEEHDQDVHTLVELIGKGKRVVVHCSDGAGRTGTILALHQALEKLHAGEDLNLLEVVKELRSQRASAVTADQYLYLHSYLLRLAKEKNGGELRVADADIMLEAIAAEMEKKKEMSGNPSTSYQAEHRPAVKAV